MSALPITTILFDFGGVIQVPLDPAGVRRQRDELARQLGYPDGRAMWLAFYTGPEWQAAKTGRMTGAEMWDALLTPHNIPGREAQTQFLRQLFAGEGLLPAMRDLLARLHGRYRLGILSNADDRLEDWLAGHYHIAHFFDAIVNSHRIGVAKPDPAAFEMALARLGARPGQVYFIDDQARNTAAAAALGMTVHTFTGLEPLLADLQARQLL